MSLYPPMCSQMPTLASNLVGGRPWRRPEGVPYPSDPTFRFMVTNVDNFRHAYRTEREILKRMHQRRRFLNMITVDQDGCWVWLGPRNRANRNLPTFQATWAHGRPQRPGNPFLWLIQEWFPGEMERLRGVQYRSEATCGKTSCIRPQCRKAGYNHLLTIPVQDRPMKRSLTPDLVRWIRAERRQGRSYASLAAELKVDHMTVWRAGQGETYKWVEDEPEGPENPAQRSLETFTGVSGTIGGVTPGNGAERGSGD